MEPTGIQAHVEAFRGEAVFAANGDKVGSIDKVLYDKATGKPEWLAVQTGVLGLKSRLTPFHGAERRPDGVLVPYKAGQIEAAPELQGDEISQELERRLASHYELRYSESRSPTGLPQGKKGTSARQSRARSQSATHRARKSARASRSSRRETGPTRDELYQQAKRLGIEGRSRMNKAQLERAVARGGGQRSRAAKASPFEVQKFLEAVGYPASKRELIREAKGQRAHARVRSTLEQLPDRQFGSPTEVSEAIGRLS